MGFKLVEEIESKYTPESIADRKKYALYINGMQDPKSSKGYWIHPSRIEEKYTAENQALAREKEYAAYYKKKFESREMENPYHIDWEGR